MKTYVVEDKVFIVNTFFKRESDVKLGKRFNTRDAPSKILE
jgi:hypothetical protein